MDTTRKPELLIVTGMSGAGRSTVGNALEDQGWYVIDNLPPQLLGPISDLFSLSKANLPRIAVIIDVRGGEFFNELIGNIEQLRTREINVQLLFLEANDGALVKRFESVRRPHPLQGEGTIVDGINAERKELLALREMGTEDEAGTTTIKVKVSRQTIAQIVGASREMVGRVIKGLEDRGQLIENADGTTILKQETAGLD